MGGHHRGQPPLRSGSKVTQPEEQPSAIRVLPPDYNPNVDGGRIAWQLFDSWMVPPREVFLRKNDEGETIVLAYGGHPIVL